MKFVQIWRPSSLFWQLRELSVPGTHESVGFTVLNRCKAPDSQWASCASCNYCFLSTRVVPHRAHWDPPLNLLDAISQTSRLVAGQPGEGSTQETNSERGVTYGPAWAHINGWSAKSLLQRAGKDRWKFAAWGREMEKMLSRRHDETVHAAIFCLLK